MGLLSFNSDWENVVDADRNNLVFESRNKAYGAYVIRREYDRAVMYSFFIAASFAILISLVPVIANHLKGDASDVTVIPDTPFDLIEITMPEKSEVVKPAIPQSEEKVVSLEKVIKFTVPVAVDDKLITETIPCDTETSTGKSNNDPKDQTEMRITEPKHSSGGNLLGDDRSEVFILVEQMPEFPGGFEALSKYIQQNVRYPEFERSNGIEGVVYVSFVINAHGFVKEIETLKGVKGGQGLVAEAKRVIESMPRWQPGRNNGHPVNVRMNLPIAFQLSR